MSTGNWIVEMANNATFGDNNESYRKFLENYMRKFLKDLEGWGYVDTKRVDRNDII